MNLTESIVPKSDQLNADDLIAGPVTVTIVEVRKGTPEQPVSVFTEEFGNGRPYKPSKSMRRVLVTAWGAETDAYAGRKLTLFRNPKIKFGGEEVGGIQISHMSHIGDTLSVKLTVARGKRAPHEVLPIDTPPPAALKDESGRDWLTELADAAKIDQAAVGALGVEAKAAHADPVVVNLISKTWYELAPKTQGESA
ncbi:hypothetical protein [Herbiconiux solani]|uniref:hypothetical protein n=1 Tax=Herbiconiux solani TaxID=661329 RepID=UPI0008240DF1|nr:hypothetical protein [Herbiconiux solani]